MADSRTGVANMQEDLIFQNQGTNKCTNEKNKQEKTKHTRVS